MLLFRTGRGTLNAYIGIGRKHITRTRQASECTTARRCRRASGTRKDASLRRFATARITH